MAQVLSFLMLKSPKSKKMAKFFADFRPLISRENWRKKLHEKLATNSAGREIKFFHRETLGFWGDNLSLSLCNLVMTNFSW